MTLSNVSIDGGRLLADLNFGSTDDAFGCRLHEQANFPVAGMVAERDRLAIWASVPPLGAQDQDVVSINLGRRPAHACILRHSEQVARRPVAQHVVC